MPRPKKAMMTWKERALEKAKDKMAKAPVSEGSLISIKGGVFTYSGAPMAEEIDIVILDECIENSYYTKPFSESEFQIPECWALSEPLSIAVDTMGANMAPDPRCSNPQSTDCASCQWNQFGTSQFGSGQGKACGNRRRLLLMAADDLSSIDKAMVAVIKVPPTGLKIWDAHRSWLYRIQEVSPEYCITRMRLQKLRPTDQSALPMYEHMGYLPDELCDEIDTIIERNQHILLQPFPDAGSAQVEVTPKRRAPKKKAVRR